MDKLVKQIIKHSKKEDKSGKFLSNGLVEILLVKVGILLALAIYGFYLNYVEQKKIHAYFLSIHNEISPILKKDIPQTKYLDASILKVTNCLNILNSKNKDSISYLKNNLGPIVKINNNVHFFPAVKEFLASTYFSKVKNKETIELLRDLKNQLATISRDYNYSERRYLLTIEPFMNNYVNYLEITNLQLKNKGPKSDFNALYNNVTMWNILSQKLKNLNNQLTRQHEFGSLLNKLNTNLENQLNK